MAAQQWCLLRATTFGRLQAPSLTLTMSASLSSQYVGGVQQAHLAQVCVLLLQPLTSLHWLYRSSNVTCISWSAWCMKCLTQSLLSTASTCPKMRSLTWVRPGHPSNPLCHSTNGVLTQALAASVSPTKESFDTVWSWLESTGAFQMGECFARLRATTCQPVKRSATNPVKRLPFMRHHQTLWHTAM